MRGSSTNDEEGVDLTFTNYFGRDRRPGETPAPAVEPKPVTPAPRAAEPRGLTAFLDAGAVFSGVLRTRGTVRIGGEFEGRIESEDYVILSESARVHADIDAEAAVISGEVRGNVTARRKITLDASARVTGDLCTPGIVIEEGARLRGRITIGGEDDAIESAAERPARAEAPAPPAANLAGGTPRPAAANAPGAPPAAPRPTRRPERPAVEPGA
jgi:cytoskeletal protein CcmA (bactofilin family)